VLCLSIVLGKPDSTHTGRRNRSSKELSIYILEPIWVSVHIHQAASKNLQVKMGELHCCPSFICVWHQIMSLCLKMFVDNGCCIPTKCQICCIRFYCLRYFNSKKYKQHCVLKGLLIITIRRGGGLFAVLQQHLQLVQHWFQMFPIISQCWIPID